MQINILQTIYMYQEDIKTVRFALFVDITYSNIEFL